MCLGLGLSHFASLIKANFKCELLLLQVAEA